MKKFISILIVLCGLYAVVSFASVRASEPAKKVMLDRASAINAIVDAK